SLLISGNLDLILTKPYHPFVKILFGGVDFLDLIMLLPFFLVLNIILVLQFTNFFSFLGFWVFIFNSFLILTSFHILVLAMAIFTTDVDHTIFIYRDIMRLGQFPIDIYQKPISFILTFILPIGVITTFPVKIFYQLLTWQNIVFSFLVSSLFLIFSLKIWGVAIRKYQSASS
ncbi:MAG: ABC-2 family transporter protein, partial [Microgenomates group bacterium]